MLEHRLVMAGDVVDKGVIYWEWPRNVVIG